MEKVDSLLFNADETSVHMIKYYPMSSEILKDKLKFNSFDFTFIGINLLPVSDGVYIIWSETCFLPSDLEIMPENETAIKVFKKINEHRPIPNIMRCVKKGNVCVTFHKYYYDGISYDIPASKLKQVNFVFGELKDFVEHCVNYSDVLTDSTESNLSVFRPKFVWDSDIDLVKQEYYFNEFVKSYTKLILKGPKVKSLYSILKKDFGVEFDEEEDKEEFEDDDFEIDFGKHFEKYLESLKQKET